MTQKEESKEQPRRRRRSKAEQDQPAAEAEKGQGEDQSSNGKAPEPSPPPRLLQRLRDEAHRFANSFNAELRSRRIRESTLDDFPGIGPVRRDCLLGHFGTIEKLRKANEDELRQVEGIGPNLAAELALYLREGKVKT